MPTGLAYEASQELEPGTLVCLLAECTSPPLPAELRYDVLQRLGVLRTLANEQLWPSGTDVGYMEQPSTSAQTMITAYPVSNYNFGAKAAKLEKDRSTQERLLRMEDK